MSQDIKLSVVICTHNPREDYLRRVLHALQEQTLPNDQWELLLIDNASRKDLSTQFDISWHPQSRHVREYQLGLTNARLKGFVEASGDLLVFVDDDNILDTDYLQQTWLLAEDFPFLGAWGGAIYPEFAIQPDESLRPYLHMLALRDVDKPKWSNLPDWSCGTCPAGAGMAVRRSVFEQYAAYCDQEPHRRELDRKGQSLNGCGDLDLAFTACDLGMGTGLFPQLRLKHLIPTERLSREYLLKLAEGNAYSGAWLEYFRKRTPPASTTAPVGIISTTVETIRFCRQLFSTRRGLHYKINLAFARGAARARVDILKLHAQGTPSPSDKKNPKNLLRST